MELEGIGTITMSGILVKVLRKIDDLNGFERTFLKREPRRNFTLLF